MKNLPVSLLPLFFAGASALLGSLQNEAVDCLLIKVEVLFLDEREHPEEPMKKNNGFICYDESENISYEIGGIDASFFFDDDSSKLKSGETILSISSATKVKADSTGPNRIQANRGALISLSSNKDNNNNIGRLRGRGHRALAPKTGGSNVLVVRVSDTLGTAPYKTAPELYSDWFDDAANLVTQMKACSGGQLTMNPAPDDANLGIKDGVLDLVLPGDLQISGSHKRDVEDWARNLLVEIAGDKKISTWDHIVFVLPRTSSWGAGTAYAHENGHTAVFKDGVEHYLLIQMHELGHNLGLGHSGEKGNRYGDRTCFMGAHETKDDGPLMCYNAAKSWQLGWYSPGHKTVTPGSWDGRLVGVQDYLYPSSGRPFDANAYTSVLRIEKPDSITDLYVMYNRAKGVNSQVVGHRDTVTVVESEESTSQSWLLGALTETVEYNDSSWPGGTALKIKVCSRSIGDDDSFDDARVLVYLDNDENRLTCDSSEPVTPKPSTRMPSSKPTLKPTTNSEGKPTPETTSDPKPEPTPESTIMPATPSDEEPEPETPSDLKPGTPPESTLKPTTPSEEEPKPETPSDPTPETPPESTLKPTIPSEEKPAPDTTSDPTPETPPESTLKPTTPSEEEPAPETPSDSKPETPPESTLKPSEEEPAPETPSDPKPETPPESTLIPTTLSEEEPAPETTPDPKPETPPESTLKPTTPSEEEPAPETPSDSKPETPPESTLKPTTPSEEEPAPETTADPEPEASAEATIEPIPERTPEPTLEPSIPEVIIPKPTMPPFSEAQRAYIAKLATPRNCKIWPFLCKLGL